MTRDIAFSVRHGIGYVADAKRRTKSGTLPESMIRWFRRGKFGFPASTVISDHNPGVDNASTLHVWQTSVRIRGLGRSPYRKPLQQREDSLGRIARVNM